MRVCSINIVLFILLSPVAQAQVNLVPNPSFEDTLNCAGSYVTSNIEIAYPWYSASNSTSDFYSSYLNCGYPASSSYPNSLSAFHGSSYSGLYMYGGIWREYIGVKLLDTLEAGKEYCVSFRVVRRSIFGGGTDSFGAYFDQDSIYDPINTNLSYIPQIESPFGDIPTDTSTWKLISGKFTANGDERFMALGNFRDNANTTYSIVDSNVGGFAYYHFDSVWVFLCEETVGITENQNESFSFTILNETLFYDINSDELSYDISIIDMKGRVVYSESYKSQMDQPISLRGLSDGLYILNYTSPGRHIAKKFFYNRQ